MNDKILIKKFSPNIDKELESIDFSKNYAECAKLKLCTLHLKFLDLKPPEANILKQSCLSLGFDAAVGKDVITCKCEKSDALVCGSKSQFLKLANILSKQPFRLKKLASDIANIINSPKSYLINNKSFDYDKTYLMGILNITPDSFSDGGKNFNPENAYTSAMEMIENGADIIDIGGESTRPGATPVTYEEEIKRILPVIKKIRSKNSDIILSIDTIHPQTAEIAIKEGINILNNVGSVEIFKTIFPLLSNYKIPIVITHSNCIPPVPVEKDFEGDIVDSIFKFFNKNIQYMISNSLNNNLFILDPGIGFGKSINDQFELIKRADEFFTLQQPVLYGISKKSFIFKTFGNKSIEDATIAYNQFLMQKKINILRIHDVKKHNKIRTYLSKIT